MRSGNGELGRDTTSSQDNGHALKDNKACTVCYKDQFSWVDLSGLISHASGNPMQVGSFLDRPSPCAYR